jgi:hypothetical protein
MTCQGFRGEAAAWAVVVFQLAYQTIDSDCSGWQMLGQGSSQMHFCDWRAVAQKHLYEGLGESRD